MNIAHAEHMLREFALLQREVRDTIASGDLATTRDALGEIEAIWMHCQWPRLREATATFLRNHAEYADAYCVGVM